MGLWNFKIIGLWNWDVVEYMMSIWILIVIFGLFSLSRFNYGK